MMTFGGNQKQREQMNAEIGGQYGTETVPCAAVFPQHLLSGIGVAALDNAILEEYRKLGRPRPPIFDLCHGDHRLVEPFVQQGLETALETAHLQERDGPMIKIKLLEVYELDQVLNKMYHGKKRTRTLFDERMNIDAILHHYATNLKTKERDAIDVLRTFKKRRCDVP